MPKEQYDFDNNEQTESNGGNGDKPKAPRLRSASRSKLPLTSAAIDDGEMHKQAVKLLREGVKLRTQESEIKDRLEEIKAELAVVASVYDLPGFRNGLAGFEYRGYTSRTTLKKDRLVELLSRHGIPVNELDGCYAAGEPFLDVKIFSFDLE